MVFPFQRKYAENELGCLAQGDGAAATMASGPMAAYNQGLARAAALTRALDIALPGSFYNTLRSRIKTEP